MSALSISFFFFFFNDTATTEIYTLSLHDALPICHEASQRERSFDHVPAAEPEDGQRTEAPEASHQGDDRPPADRESQRSTPVLAAEIAEAGDLLGLPSVGLHHVDPAQILLRLVADFRELLLGLVAVLVDRPADPVDSEEQKGIGPDRDQGQAGIDERHESESGAIA